MCIAHCFAYDCEQFTNEMSEHCTITTTNERTKSNENASISNRHISDTDIEAKVNKSMLKEMQIYGENLNLDKLPVRRSTAEL